MIIGAASEKVHKLRLNFFGSQVDRHASTRDIFIDMASQSTRKVQEALARHGLDVRVADMPGSTRTARDAALAVGCTVGQIAKSLVFAAEDGSLLLAITSGSNRVDVGRLAAVVGSTVRMADPDTVRQATGFAIGGVAPVGHARPLPVVIDEDLLQYEQIWAAAGTPRSVFPIAPDRLVEITGGRVAAFAETS